jgi:predicted RNA-binding Zn ribbon-like protein
MVTQAPGSLSRTQRSITGSRQREVVSITEPIEVIVGLGDDQALELLNTRAVPAPGVQVELIGDGAGYLAWLTRAGLIEERDLEAIAARFSPVELDEAAAAARDLRERLRLAVMAWIEDPAAPIPSEVIDRLNTVLESGQRFAQLHPDNTGGLEVHDHHRWTHLAQLLVPVAETWARLLADGEPALVRQCEGCTIIFYDRTKAHRRRWCSMALCGNREKVRRHRAGIADKKDPDAETDPG